MPRPADLFRPLADAEPGILFRALADARPATIALVLSYLPRSLSMQVAGKLDAVIRQRVLGCLAANEPRDFDAIAIVAQSVIERVRSLQSDGTAILARILGECDSQLPSQFLQQLGDSEPALAQRVRLTMPTFAELNWLTDRELRTLIKSVDLSTWALALSEDGPLLTRIRACLSENARLQLQDEMNYRRLATPEERDHARTEIVAAMRQIRQPLQQAIA